VQRLQAFKYELRPNGAQRRDMGRFAGSRRFVYNKALALQKAHYEAGGTFMGYVAMAKRLTEWRHSGETPWLQEAPVHPLQHALKDLERAYRNFFARRGKFPRFKRKGRSESFRYPDAKQFQIDPVNSRIKLPKLAGAISCTRPRPPSAKTTRWCVSRICRCAICPGRPEATQSKRVRMFEPSRV
jgi:putative transposase